MEVQNLTQLGSEIHWPALIHSMAPVQGKQDVPWADRHRPRHLGEVVGNTEQIRKLAEWLRDWDDVVLRGEKKELPTPQETKKFQPPPENINARAVLVSGPPGIGKTTTLYFGGQMLTLQGHGIQCF